MTDNIVSAKTRRAFYIPFFIVTAILLYNWFLFIVTDATALLRHYIALLLYLVILFLLRVDKTLKKPLLAVGVYLLLASLGYISLLSWVGGTSYGVRIVSLELQTPQLTGVPLTIFILYALLAFDPLTDIYLDYKEAREKRREG